MAEFHGMKIPNFDFMMFSIQFIISIYFSFQYQNNWTTEFNAKYYAKI